MALNKVERFLRSGRVKMFSDRFIIRFFSVILRDKHGSKTFHHLFILANRLGR